MKEFFPVLHTAALFSGISDDELAAMLSCLGARIDTFPKGSRLLRAGEAVEEVGLVLAGSALIVQEDIWGNRNILSKAGPGQTFAEVFACAPGSVLNVSVEAESAVTVMFLRVKRVLTHLYVRGAFLQILAQSFYHIGRNGSCVFCSAEKLIKRHLVLGAIIGGIFRRKTELSAFHRIAQGKNDIAFVHIESAGVERGNFSVFVLNDIAVFVFHFHGRNIGQIADAVFPIRRNEKIFISQKCVAEYISAAAFHAVTAVAPIPEQIDDLEIIRVYDGGKHAERIAVSRKRNIRRQFVLVVLDAKIAVVPLVELLHHRLIMVDIIMRGTISDNQLFVIKKDLYGNYADQHNSHNARADLLIPYHRSEERRVGKECRSRWSPYH